MGFQKIDKKQMPQVIGLGVASCGMFGFFAFKMIAPTASAAPPPPPAKNAKVAAAAAAPASEGAGAAPAATPDAKPPTPGMRDPFIPTDQRQSRPGAAPRDDGGSAPPPEHTCREPGQPQGGLLADGPARPAAAFAGTRGGRDALG